MSIISFGEILQLLLTVAALGYIFSGSLRRYETDPLKQYKRFDLKDFLYSALIASPGIILHELAHKFTALSFGLEATYQIFPLGLAIGIILKAINSSFLLLAPGYVVINGANSFQSSLSAFAGPFINLLLWLGCALLLKKSKNMTHNQALVLTLMKNMNRMLFLFNMIPIPPLDGYKVFEPFFRMLF